MNRLYRINEWMEEHPLLSILATFLISLAVVLGIAALL